MNPMSGKRDRAGVYIRQLERDADMERKFAEEQLGRAERRAFKAGMIAMLRHVHVEFTGVPYDKPIIWKPEDQILQRRLFREWKKE